MQQTVILSSSCKSKRQKWLFLLNGTQYARPKMAERSTQGQNRAVRSTQGGGGVTLIRPIIIKYTFKSKRAAWCQYLDIYLEYLSDSWHWEIVRNCNFDICFTDQLAIK